MPETPNSSYQYGAWTVTKLKNELRSRNLSPSGNKHELIARLERAEPSSSSPEDYLCRSASNKQSPEVVRTATPDGKDAARMKVNELREELLSLGMSPIGKKADLVQRLKEAQGATNPFMDRLKISSSVTRSQSRGRSRSTSRTPRRNLKQKSKSPTRRNDTAIMTENDIGLMTSPLTTLYLALKCGLSVAGKTFRARRRRAMLLLYVPMALIFLMLSLFVNGPQEKFTAPIREWLLWYGRWIFLGILSSVGLGTGAHTFLLFLGPFIARASTAAHVCKTLDFSLRGPSALLCPADSYHKLESISILSVFFKIRWEAFAWGLGTAIGELPPYLIARASAVAGRSAGHLNRMERLARKTNRTWAQSLQLASFSVISQLGFFGILLLASIPNPLFDLAGIMSGYFLIPFATFITALFLGKAVIKSALQTMFVIFLFSRDYLEQSFEFIKKRFPSIASHFSEWIVSQRAIFQERKPNPMIETASTVWHVVLIAMMGYFVMSVIHSAAVMEARKQGILRKAE